MAERKRSAEVLNIIIANNNCLQIFYNQFLMEALYKYLNKPNLTSVKAKLTLI